MRLKRAEEKEEEVPEGLKRSQWRRGGWRRKVSHMHKVDFDFVGFDLRFPNTYSNDFA